MRIDVTPDPSSDELAAILLAVERYLTDSAAAVWARPLWNLAEAPSGWRETARFEAINDGV